MQYRLSPEINKVIGLLVLFVASQPLCAIMAQTLFSPAQEFRIEKEMFSFVQARTKAGGFLGQVDIAATVGVIASPTQKLVSVRDLNDGALLGTIYLPTGSIRLTLKPGIYGVFVARRTQNVWTARFQTSRGEVVGEAPAQLIPSGQVERVSVSFERSICYHINGGIVCI